LYPPVEIKWWRETLVQRSGFSEEEINKKLSEVLPGVVDKLTPRGRLPTAAELSDMG